MTLFPTALLALSWLSVLRQSDLYFFGLCGAWVFELVHFFGRLCVHLYVSRWPWLDAADDNFAVVAADFHPVFSRCFLQSLSELLQFFFTAFEQINVIDKPQVAKRSFSYEFTGIFCIIFSTNILNNTCR